MDFAFERVGLNRVYAFNLTRNPAAGRMMEKVGMRPEGIQRQAIKVRGTYEDLALWAMLRSDWEALRAAG